MVERKMQLIYNLTRNEELHQRNVFICMFPGQQRKRNNKRETYRKTYVALSGSTRLTSYDHSSTDY